MDCSFYQSTLSDYMDGTLGAQRASEVRTHLQECSVCHAEYEEVARLRAMLGELKAPVARPDFWRHTRAALQARSEKELLPVRKHTVFARGAEAPRAALMVVLVVCGMVGVGMVWVNHFQIGPQETPPTLHFKRQPYASASSAKSGPVASSYPASRSSLQPTIAFAPLRPASNARFAVSDAISVDALISLHAGHSSYMPLADTGRLRYMVTEADQADLKTDGKLDIR